MDKRDREIENFKNDIKRDPVGSKLTPDALHEAATFAADSFKGSTNVGQAKEIGIRHVMSRVFKDGK